jgi:hypothetical protein
MYRVAAGVAHKITLTAKSISTKHRSECAALMPYGWKMVKAAINKKERKKFTSTNSETLAIDKIDGLCIYLYALVADFGGLHHSIV